MANYAIVTNFLSKDSLVSGNALKAVKGADFTTEFTAVQTALNSKFDGAIVFAPDGTATQPSFGFTNNAGTGVYNTSGALGFSTGATNRFTLSAAGGLFAAGVTGGDKGVGTLNAAGLFVNNVAVALSGSGVTSLAGTANQIAASASTGAVTLSLAQNVIIPAPSSGVPFIIHGLAGNDTLFVQGSSTAGQSFGLEVLGGTNSADYALSVSNQSSGVNFALIHGDGSGFIRPTASTGLSWSANGAYFLAAPSSGNTLTASGSAIQFASKTTVARGSGSNWIDFQDPTGESAYFGFGGANSNFNVQNLLNGTLTLGTNNAVNLTITAAGGFFTNGATGGDQGAGTFNATGLFINGVAVTAGSSATTGSFTGTITGVTAATPTCHYTKIGTTVTLRIAAWSSTGTLTSQTMTGLPAAIQPATANVLTTVSQQTDATTAGWLMNASVAGGTMTFSLNKGTTFGAGNFTGSGTRAMSETTLVYDVS